jgi:ubiquinone/menaquinone biosynthesis C-methylase UbiE
MVVESDYYSRVIDKLEIEDWHNVIDIGCGNGLHSLQAGLKHPRNLIDIDIDLISLGKLKKQIRSTSSSRSSNCLYVCADALKLPFSKSYFDRAICSLVFCLLPWSLALAELHRIMKPGGKVYIRTPILSLSRALVIFHHSKNLRDSIYRVSQVFSGLWYAIIGYQLPNLINRHDKWACYIPKNQFEKAVLHAGFQIDSLDVAYSRFKEPSIDAQLMKL